METTNSTGVAVRARCKALGRFIIGGILMLTLAACGGSGGGDATGPTLPTNAAPDKIVLTKHTIFDAQPTAGGYVVGEVYGDDPDGDTVSLSIVGGADEGNFTLSGNELILDDGVLDAASKGSYEVLVRAQDPDSESLEVTLTVLVVESEALQVGYYDLLQNDGRAEQATPIEFIGETAVNIGDIAVADLSGLDMLFVQNANSSGVSGPYAAEANLAKVAEFVADGGVLIFHDRYVQDIEDYLPGQPGSLTQDLGGTRTRFELVEALSFIAQGPGGVVDGANLESPNSLTFGYADATTVPRGSIGYLSRSDANQWTTFSYPHGMGRVIYSSIPLDFYLLNGNPEVMRSVYAPNVLAEGRALRDKGVDNDGDGLRDAEEDLVGSSTTTDDTDGDGLTDYYETRSGLDPTDNGDASVDTDGDGLNNIEEQAAGSYPRIADSDEDGISDGDEVNTWSTNPVAVDTDGDGLWDGDEIDVFGTDPTLADTDGGGSPDGVELNLDETDPLNAADDFAQISLPVNHTDVNGFLWDIQGDGNINNGSNDAYDGGMRLLIGGSNFPQFTEASLADGIREIRLGLATMSGLQVSRRIFVPTDAAFVRYLDVLENPTESDIPVEAQISTNLGSDGGTVVVSTSDGDTAVEAGDTWVVTDDASNGGGDPSLAHVAAGSGGAVQPVIAVPLGSISYTYDVIVPANGRVIIMHFDSQNANRAAATTSAGSLGALGGRAIDGISTEDMADIVNFSL